MDTAFENPENERKITSPQIRRQQKHHEGCDTGDIPNGRKTIYDIDLVLSDTVDQILPTVQNWEKILIP